MHSLSFLRLKMKTTKDSTNHWPPSHFFWNGFLKVYQRYDYESLKHYHLHLDCGCSDPLIAATMRQHGHGHGPPFDVDGPGNVQGVLMVANGSRDVCNLLPDC
ncbi:hypothetical protein J6590_016452 [Homalodisca vitripennis]|nr:hypothetical protein J6590_016452 [Homalodisca vitripennis]